MLINCIINIFLKGNYTIDNFKLNMDVFPEMTPSGNYQGIVSYQQGSKFIFGFELILVVKKLKE